MKVKPKKAKVSDLPTPRFLRSAAAWRPNSIKRVLSGWTVSENASNRSRIASRKRRASPSCSKKATGVALMLETGHQIIGVAHDDHVASGLLPSPAFRPQIENVVQV